MGEWEDADYHSHTFKYLTQDGPKHNARRLLELTYCLPKLTMQAKLVN